MTVQVLPGCVNARDLGGLRLGAGLAVVDKTLLRSDNLDRLTLMGVDALRGLGVTRILDLRFGWESRKYPGPFTGDPIYLNVPFVEMRDDFDPDAPIDYRPEIDRSPGSIAAALTAFAEAPAGPVLVHCHAGRDRTGMFVALVLAVAGAAAEVIAEDYVLSDGAEAATMLAMLDHVKRRYGGAENYLRGAGVERDHLDAVVRRLTGSPRAD